MKNISVTIQYEFLKPIEELFNKPSGLYVFYCNRENEPYFFTAYFNKNKGLAMLPRLKCFLSKYSNEYLENIENFNYYSENLLDNLKEDNISFYSKIDEYLEAIKDVSAFKI